VKNRKIQHTVGNSAATKIRGDLTVSLTVKLHLLCNKEPMYVLYMDWTHMGGGACVHTPELMLNLGYYWPLHNAQIKLYHFSIKNKTDLSHKRLVH